MDRDPILISVAVMCSLLIVSFGVIKGWLDGRRALQRPGKPIGVRGATGRSEDEEYHAGHRDFHGVPVGLSGAASAESAWVLLGLVGIAYGSGIGALWLIPGCALGYLFTFRVMGPALRAAAARSNSVTIPSVLAALAGPYARSVRMAAAVIMVVCVTAYAAAQLNAVGKTLDALAGVPYVLGVAIGLGVVVAYLSIGGIRASVWTDVPQSFLIVSTLLLIPIVGSIAYEGSLSATLAEHGEMFDIFGGSSGMVILGFLMGWLGIGLGYMGQPHVLQRPLIARNEAAVKQAGLVAATWATLVFTGAILSGVVIRAWLPDLADPEQALPAFAEAFLPAPIAGIVFAAIFAAILSTADSQLMVLVGVVKKDLLEPLGLRIQSSRAILVALGFAAFALAATENRAIFGFVLYAWAILGASIGPALIGGLLWPRASGKGMLTGMIGGGLTAAIWKAVPTLSGLVYELVPAFVVGMILTRFVAQRPGGEVQVKVVNLAAEQASAQ